MLHASGHILNVNTRALELAGLLRKGIDHPGMPLGDDGLPTGELKGPEAMTLVAAHVGFDREAARLRRAGPALLRAAVRAQGRDDGDRPGQPAAAGGGRR